MVTREINPAETGKRNPGPRGNGNLAGQPERCYPVPNGVILSGERVPVKGFTERRSENYDGADGWGRPVTREVTLRLGAGYDTPLAELSRFGHDLLEQC
jgi:hypothetical protein